MATKKGMTRTTARKAYEFPKRGAITADLQKKLAAARKRASVATKKNNENFFSGSGIKLQAAATIAGGGAIAGATKVYMPTIAGFSTPLVAGTTLVASSMLMKGNGLAPALGALGAGMLSAWSSDATAMALMNMRESAAAPSNGQ